MLAKNLIPADNLSIEFWFKSTQGIGTGAQWFDGAGMVDSDVAGQSTSAS